MINEKSELVLYYLLNKNYYEHAKKVFVKNARGTAQKVARNPLCQLYLHR